VGHTEFEKLMRLSFGMTCAVLNFVLQFSFLYWIGKWVVVPAVSDVQKDYRRYHAEMFDEDGQMLEMDHFMEWPLRERMCNLVLTDFKFTFAVLFLWVGNCLIDIRRSQRLCRGIMSLPRLPRETSITEMVVEEGTGDGEEHLLVCISGFFRALIIAVIVVPKYGIAILLSIFGCTWLTATESFSDLILNSLALVFVVDIDEIIYEAFIPEALKHSMSCFKIATPEHKGEEEDHAAKKLASVRAAYMRSWQTLLFDFLIVYVFMKFQWVLPHYKWDIRDRCAAAATMEVGQALCQPWEADCFPVSR